MSMFRRHPAEPLEQATVPWLLACAVATTAPHVEHQPHWLMAIAGLALALRTEIGRASCRERVLYTV
mgnify:CR=1 FL=1